MGRLSGRSAKYADNEFVINRWIGSSRGLINSPEDQARHGASARRLSLVRARAFRIGLPLELNKLNTIFANIRNYLPPRVDLQFVLIGSVPSPTNWTRRFSDFRIRRRHVYFSPRRESSLHLEISRGTSLNDANDNHDINIADDTRFRNVSTRSRLATTVVASSFKERMTSGNIGNYSLGTEIPFRCRVQSGIMNTPVAACGNVNAFRSGQRHFINNRKHVFCVRGLSSPPPPSLREELSRRAHGVFSLSLCPSRISSRSLINRHGINWISVVSVNIRLVDCPRGATLAESEFPRARARAGR